MLFNDKLYSPQSKSGKQAQVVKRFNTFRRHDLTCNSISNLFSEFLDWICDDKVEKNYESSRQVYWTWNQIWKQKSKTFIPKFEHFLAQCSTFLFMIETRIEARSDVHISSAITCWENYVGTKSSAKSIKVCVFSIKISMSCWLFEIAYNLPADTLRQSHS